MQPFPIISSDLFVPGPAASMPSATTGSEGDFASALATAANSQQGNGAQTAARVAGRDGRLSGQQPARLDEAATPGAFTDADPQELDTSLNGAAGAANLVLHFPQWSASGTGLATSAAITRDLPEQSAVMQLLSAIAMNGSETAVGESLAGTPTQNGAFLLNGMDIEQSVPQPTQSTLQTMVPPVQQTQAATPQTVVTTALTGEVVEAAISGDAEPSTPETIATGKTTNDVTVLTATILPTAVSAANRQTAIPSAATPEDAGVFVQKETSQAVVTSQAVTDEQAPQAAAAGSGAVPGSETSGIRQEINGDFLRSNLPDAIADVTADDNSSQQQDQAGDKGQNNGSSANSAGQSSSEQMLAQRAQVTTAQDGQPLLFAHQLDSSQSAAIGSTTPASSDPSMVRLPSGAMVPEGTVMDQMISHFAMNKRLETSTVNLRLHPQELGELRMEIKVEQDNIKAHIIAQNPHAQEMIDRHLPRLREALEQQGLHLAQVEVTLAANDRTDSQAFQDNLSQNLMNRTLKNKSPQPAFSLRAGEETGEAVQAPRTLSVMV